MCLDIATPSGGNFAALIISSVLNIKENLPYPNQPVSWPFPYTKGQRQTDLYQVRLSCQSSSP